MDIIEKLTKITTTHKNPKIGTSQFFNCDPETEVVLPRLKNDLLDLFIAVSMGSLDSKKIEVDSRATSTVVLVSGGYPENYEKGKIIKGLSDVENSLVFHAGAQNNKDNIVTSGGRVLAITSYGNTVREALNKSYRNIEKIHFDKMNYRKDIGFDL